MQQEIACAWIYSGSRNDFGGTGNLVGPVPIQGGGSARPDPRGGRASGLVS